MSTYNSQEIEEVNLFSEELSALINTKGECRNIVFLCIGSDRATGDSLGPLVGYNLKKLGHENIYGTLEEPVHALNLDSTIKLISSNVDNPLVIAIDASLGGPEDIGCYTVKNGPIKPGSGIGGQLPYVGDISITGIVSTSGTSGVFLLRSTRLGLVMKIAERISHGINQCINLYMA